MPFDAIRLAWRRQNKMSPLEPSHMNALPGGDRLIPFSLAPTGLTRFFEVTQAKAWAMLSWPFGPFTPPLERAPTGPLPPVPRPKGPRKLSPGFSLGCPKKRRQPCRGKRSLFAPWKASIREGIPRPGHRPID
jgi:hypothetical protein